MGKFWTITQNNSGGIFDHDAAKGIGYAICVEAVDADDAEARIDAIVANYPASYDCPCCGDRWYTSMYGENGEDEPMLYGQPLKGSWGTPSYIHYMDGRIEEREVAA